MLPASCINCSTINTFKKHLSAELESEAVKFKVISSDSRHNTAKIWEALSLYAHTTYRYVHTDLTVKYTCLRKRL